MNKTPKNKEQVEIRIRWLIRKDMLEVLEIEHQSFEFSWSEEDFLIALRQRNCIGMVAEGYGTDYRDKILGFMIYELHRSTLNVLNFAVHPEFRRRKVGSQMTDKLKDKLSQQGKQEIILELKETNLPAQLFFKSQGFRAIGVLRNHYENTDDAYVMRYKLGETSPYPEGIFVLRNRISQYDPKIFRGELEKMFLQRKAS